ncbi:MAG: hypothetical protein L6Q83_02590 [Gammaproteobacteria bacterium]|nr:hypothetical protein [Gammaproteobacteria bacterium]
MLSAGVVLLVAPLALAGNGALLGVQVDYPRINFTEGAASQGATYDGSTLTITSTPIFLTFTNGGTAEFISSGSLTITANIDGGGAFSGGSFSISGSVTDTATSNSYSGTLLAGTVDDYGIVDVGGPGGTDLADFDLTATSGSLKSLFDAVNSNVAIVLSLEGSGFAGSFAAAWSADRAKGDAGPQPSTPSQPPHTIGYWKNHPEAWGVTSMTICGNTLNQTELISVLSAPPRGDVTIIMAKQLIAARLNVAVGNSCPLTTDAEAWLCSHGGIGASRKQWDGGEEIKDALDAFNNGTGNCTL